MEKLKSIAKSIWAKIPKTKTEFKDLFDKCVYFYNEHKAWLHRLGFGISIALWGFILLAMLSNFFTLYFSGEETPNRASEVRLAVFTLTAWIGAPFLVWRTMIASKQAETAQEQAVIAQEKAYTELFTQAIEQLGSEKPETTTIKDKNGELIVDEAGRPLTEEKYVPNIEVRVGAIYALGRIMKDSDKDALTIIDTLCTYVKHNCGKPKIFENEIPEEEFEKLSENEIAIKRNEFNETLKENPPANRYDIQTALTIIGRRPEKHKTKETRPDLTNVNLQGANLVKFDLSLCNLANASLEGADLEEANLQGANLLGADLLVANLQETDLQGANLWRAKLQLAKLQEADLEEANLQGANLLGADLLVANLQETDLQGANLWRAKLQEANLWRAKLQEAKLQEADLEEANLQGANLWRAKLQGAKLQGAKLQEANLWRAKLQEADLEEAKLQGANLQGANLWRANLWRAKLQEADLEEANLQDVQITDAHKTAASVIWIDFTKAKYDLEKLQEQVKDMYGHKTLTKLPDGMKIPDHWSEVDMDTAEGWGQYHREWEAFKKKKRFE